jgi:streptogramin lyase
MRTLLSMLLLSLTNERGGPMVKLRSDNARASRRTMSRANGLFRGLTVAITSLLVTASALYAQGSANLFVSSFGNNQVLQYNGANGLFVDVFVPPTITGLNGPWSVAFGPDGNLYVSSFATDEVLRYDGQSGEFIDSFVPAGRGGLDQPFTLVFGADGNLYVNSTGTGQILRYNGQTGTFIDVFVSAGSGGLAGPTTVSHSVLTATST